MAIPLGYDPSLNDKQWYVKNTSGHLVPVEKDSTAAPEKVSVGLRLGESRIPVKLAAEKILLGSEASPMDGSWAINGCRNPDSPAQRIYAAKTQKAVDEAVSLLRSNPQISLKQLLGFLIKKRQELARSMDYMRAVVAEYTQIGSLPKNQATFLNEDFSHLDFRAKMVGVPRDCNHGALITNRQIFDKRLKYEALRDRSFGRFFRAIVHGQTDKGPVELSTNNIIYDLALDGGGKPKLILYSDFKSKAKAAIYVFPIEVDTEGKIKITGEAEERLWDLPDFADISPDHNGLKRYLSSIRETPLPGDLSRAAIPAKELVVDDDSLDLLNKHRVTSIVSITPHENLDDVWGHLDSLFEKIKEAGSPREVLELVKEMKAWIMQSYPWNKGNAALADNLSKVIFIVNDIAFGRWKEEPVFHSYLSQKSIETSKETYESLYA